MKPIAIKRGSAVVKIYSAPVRNQSNDRIYPGFLIKYYEHGKTRQEHRSKLKTARERAAEIALRIANGETRRAELDDQQIAAFNRASEFVAPTGKSIELACEQFALAYGQLPKDVSLGECVGFYKKHNITGIEPRSIMQLLETFLIEKDGENISPEHRRDLKNRLLRAGKYFRCPIHQIKAEDMARWLRELADQKTGKALSPQSRINYRAALQNFLKSATARPHLPADSKEISIVKKPKVIRVKTEIYSPEEMTTLLYAAAGYIKLPLAGIEHPPPNKEQLANLREIIPYLAIGAFGSTRNSTAGGEITQLKWSDIDFKNRQICLDDGVAKIQDRYIPIPANLMAWLLPFAKKTGPVVPCDIRKRRQLLCRLTGIRWLWNGLRHSCISYHYALTNDIAKVAADAGNSPAVIFSRYKKSRPKSYGKSWFNIYPPDHKKLIALPKTVTNRLQKTG